MRVSPFVFKTHPVTVGIVTYSLLKPVTLYIQGAMHMDDFSFQDPDAVPKFSHSGYKLQLLDEL